MCMFSFRKLFCDFMTESHVCSKLYQCISSTFMRAVSIIVGHAGGGILCTLEHRCFAHVRRSLDSMKSRYSTVTVYTV